MSEIAGDERKSLTAFVPAGIKIEVKERVYPSKRRAIQQMERPRNMYGRRRPKRERQLSASIPDTCCSMSEGEVANITHTNL